jgi:hypothetical protein
MCRPHSLYFRSRSRSFLGVEVLLIVSHFMGIVSIHLISLSFIPSPRLNSKVDVLL